MLKFLYIVALCGLIAACASSPDPRQGAATGVADAQLKALYEREWAWRQDEFGKERGSQGEWVSKARFPDVSAKAYERRLAYWESALEELERIDPSALSSAEAVNAAVFRQIIETLASDARFRTFEAPLNSDTFFWTGLHPQSGGFPDVEAYRRYLGRLRDLPRYFEQHQDNMRAGLARGYSVPALHRFTRMNAAA